MQNANSAPLSPSASSSSKKTKPQSLDALKKQGEKLNKQAEAKHEKNKEFKHIQTPKKCENMSQFISKYSKELEEIATENVWLNIDYKTEEWSNEYQTKMIKYFYDKKFKNEKHMRKQIYKLIVEIVYPDEMQPNKKKLRMKLSYLFECGFKYPFFIINSANSNIKFYSITYIYNFIKKAIKGKDATKEYNKIFENVSEFTPSQPAPNNQFFDCIICREQQPYITINKNCVCVENICNECFMHLQSPKTCPTCRKRPYTLTINKAEPTPAKRNFKFLYNNKTIEKSYTATSINDDDEIYYLRNGNEVDYIDFKIEEREDLISEFIENELGEHIKYFSNDFLFQYFDLPFSKAIFEVIMQNAQDLDNSDIMDLLGLTDDPEEEYTREFIEHCINIDGLGHTLHLDVIDEIEHIEMDESHTSGTHKYYQVISEIHRPDFFSLFLFN